MAHVMIIDDDQYVRSVVKQMLEAAGYVVTEASSGREGIEKHEENPADLIITDIIMPDEGGLETIMKLKRDYPKIKIIAISGGGRIVQVDFLDIAKNLGVVRTMQKPLERAELLEAVAEALALPE
ncbi:MAG TPA: response regulator [Nitrospirae bacterium]|nr:response regulator [Nitrospirota bacterium]